MIKLVVHLHHCRTKQTPETMDSGARSLSGSDAGPCNKTWMKTLFVVLIVPMMCLMPYFAFRMLQEAGRINIYMEPIVYNGLDLAGSPAAAVPPSFNVTLRAKSTYGLTKMCTSGWATMEVAYSGTTIAITDVEPFCLEPNGEKIITATASPGWLVLPVGIRESMETDRRHGGVQLEVDFGFEDELEVRWARCRTTLDNDSTSQCNIYFIRGCYRVDIDRS